MKKLCLIFILGIVSIVNSLNAQVVSYTYKPFAIEGCTMRYSVTKDNDKYYDYSNSIIRQSKIYKRTNYDGSNYKWRCDKIYR